MNNSSNIDIRRSSFNVILPLDIKLFCFSHMTCNLSICYLLKGMKGGDGESDGKFDPSMLLSLVAGLTKGIL